MITTSQNFMWDEWVRNSMEVMIPKSQRWPAFKVSEYFGIAPNDMRNTKKLIQLWVRYTKRLEELGVSFQQFKELFEDVLDNIEMYGKPETNTSSIDGLETESVVSDSTGDVKKRGRKPRA